MLKNSIRTGIAFGLTSAIITTLGLMVGLDSTTHSRVVVLGGILMIAVGDALSDALGIHVSEESKKTDGKSVWEATISTFAAKFLFALTFVIPVLFLDLPTAIIVSVIWGLVWLAVLSYAIAKANQENPLPVIAEHIGIALVVIVGTFLIGSYVGTSFIE
jgi:VIT1/CCC1 family predicted Fe2+/Mn2+ transporter